ncbi:MAG: hypothetical protein QMD09_09630, partial [Desulfatibacillaceae bacterium]|nr:hypothetical protein [Desulfatibacillaceae bacterium]
MLKKKAYSLPSLPLLPLLSGELDDVEDPGSVSAELPVPERPGARFPAPSKLKANPGPNSPAPAKLKFMKFSGDSPPLLHLKAEGFGARPSAPLQLIGALIS